MTDDMRHVPIDDDIVDDDAVLDDVIEADPTETASKANAIAPRVATSAESRDWEDQGFDANRYDERPPHWEP